MKLNIKHRYKDQFKFNGLDCYGTRYRLPKKFIILAYTSLSVIVPVIVPVFFVYFIKKYLPSYIRY